MKYIFTISYKWTAITSGTIIGALKLHALMHILYKCTLQSGGDGKRVKHAEGNYL